MSASCSSNDIYWMSCALEQAKLAAHHAEVPVGAVLVHNNRLVAQAHNAAIGSHDACAHAEIEVIRAAGQALQNYRLENCSLYVTLEPCTMCFGAMVHARIGRLVYGASEPKAGVIDSQLQLPQQAFYNHQFEVVAGVLDYACSKVLSDFFAMRREQIKAQKKAAKLAASDE